jgi:acetyltransferase-like isoleucine patch superfamily enzyme
MSVQDGIARPAANAPTPHTPRATPEGHYNRAMVRRASPAAAYVRVGWTVATSFAVETAIFGVSALPGVLFWTYHSRWDIPSEWLRIVVLSMTIVPSYLIFSMTLMTLSALAMRLLGWRTPADTEMRIEDLEWPLLDWARYMTSIHIVRVFAGAFFRSTPVWTFYIRLNGGQLGPGVYINSLALSDHNLLQFGRGVVVGDGAHISGHTVERGVVKTGRVRLGDYVTVGLGSTLGIGVEAGAGCQIGALSVVPKHALLEAGATYAGVPVRLIGTGDVTLV